MVYKRIDNLSHSDTIYYEIDMLRFTAGELQRGKARHDAWVHLEAFLTHFRNLIEFLGKPKPASPNPKDTDLHITNIWHLMGLAAPPTLRKVQMDGFALWIEYGDRSSACRISQYLHHCTQKRIDGIEWPVGKMMERIEPLLSELEKHLGPRSPDLPKQVAALRTDSLLAASTATWTETGQIIWPEGFRRG